MRTVLGWFVMVVVALASLGLGILAVAMLGPNNETYYVGVGSAGIIAGIAGGLWLKDLIGGVDDPGPPSKT